MPVSDMYSLNWVGRPSSDGGVSNPRSRPQRWTTPAPSAHCRADRYVLAPDSDPGPPRSTRDHMNFLFVPDSWAGTESKHFGIFTASDLGARSIASFLNAMIAFLRMRETRSIPSPDAYADTASGNPPVIMNWAKRSR